MIAALLAGAGCYQDDVQYGGEVSADGNADLVEVSPGVEVVADYDRPVFFADDYYWWNNGGVWYRSTWYGGGWARAGYVSPRIAGIAHPEGYVHYRPEGYVARGGSRVARGGVEPVRGGVEPVHGAAPVRSTAPVRSRPAPRGGGHRH